MMGKTNNKPTLSDSSPVNPSSYFSACWSTEALLQKFLEEMENVVRTASTHSLLTLFQEYRDLH